MLLTLCVAPGDGFRLPSRFACVAYVRMALADVDGTDEHARREKRDSSKCRPAIGKTSRWIGINPALPFAFNRPRQPRCSREARMQLRLLALPTSVTSCCNQESWLLHRSEPSSPRVYCTMLLLAQHQACLALPCRSSPEPGAPCGAISPDTSSESVKRVQQSRLAMNITDTSKNIPEHRIGRQPCMFHISCSVIRHLRIPISSRPGNDEPD